MLAAKVLQEQDIEVTGVSFTSNFFNAEKARKAAEQIGIKLKTVDISQEILELVKNPPSGHGKNLNPCVDCHALMMKKAGEIAKKEKYDFIATGEVLGQRPFSQNRQALDKIMKLADVEVLRPLSSKLLPETEIEKKGLIDRNKLLDISGRTRERQMKMAKKFGLEEYPSPAGGCLLTDPAFSLRLKAMIEHWPECTVEDVEILKYGRIFWLSFKNDVGNFPVLLIIGRNQAENEVLEKLAKKGDFMVELRKITGPLALTRIKNYELKIKNFEDNLKIFIPEKLETEKLNSSALEFNDLRELIIKVGAIAGYYSTKARGKAAELTIKMNS